MRRGSTTLNGERVEKRRFKADTRCSSQQDEEAP
jgi:hypothetical protein